jgi:predicted phage replisome organizer
MAGKQNNGGVFMMNDKIAYTDEMLATIFRRPINIVRLALNTFEQFGMVEIVNNVYMIPNWEKHQNADRLEEIREYNRLAKQKSRAKQKLLQSVNDKSMTSQQCQDTDIDVDVEEEQDKKNKNKNNISEEFEMLWKMYPNKKGKDKALSYYQKARKSGTTFEEVEKGIKNYCTEIEVKKTSAQYIKHGSTWFNQKGWLDDYDLTFSPEPEQKKSKYGYMPDDKSDLPF